MVPANSMLACEAESREDESVAESEEESRGREKKLCGGRWEGRAEDRLALVHIAVGAMGGRGAMSQHRITVLRRARVGLWEVGGSRGVTEDARIYAGRKCIVIAACRLAKASAKSGSLGRSCAVADEQKFLPSKHPFSVDIHSSVLVAMIQNPAT